MQSVEGIFDNLKSLYSLQKYLPLLAHLRKLPEFWAHIKAFELDKAGDLFEAACIAAGFADVGKVIDDIMDAIESKDASKILDELGDALKFVAAMLGGKFTEHIRLPAVGQSMMVHANTKHFIVDLIDEYGLDKPQAVSAGEDRPVENPMWFIGIAGLVLQAIRLIRDWKKGK